jgi:hypothetical protein
LTCEPWDATLLGFAKRFGIRFSQLFLMSKPFMEANARGRQTTSTRFCGKVARMRFDRSFVHCKKGEEDRDHRFNGEPSVEKLVMP